MLKDCVQGQLANGTAATLGPGGPCRPGMRLYVRKMNVYARSFAQCLSFLDRKL